MPSASPLPTVLILAGGRARRLGGREKGLAPWRGRPLIDWVIERLAPQADRLLISANRHLDDYRRRGDVISDPIPDLGPLGGLLAVLPRLRPDEHLLTVPCDTPCLPTDLATRLYHPRQVSVASDGNRTHWLIARYPPGRLATLEAYLDQGGRSVHGFLATLPHRTVAFPDPAAFANLNRPQDLEDTPCPP